MITLTLILLGILTGWAGCIAWVRRKIRWYQDHHKDCAENPTGLQAWTTARTIAEMITPQSPIWEKETR